MRRLAILVLLLVATPAWAIAPTQYYVSTSGNDSNNGLSLATAWRTIQHAVNSFGPTSLAIINIQSGIYGEAVTITQPGEAFPNNNALTCSGGPVYTTSVTIDAANWTVSSCIQFAAGPTPTPVPTAAPTQTPTPTAVPTQTPTPSPTPTAQAVGILNCPVLYRANNNVLSCPTSTPTP